MEISREIEILDPAHRERYESIDPVNEACRMGMEALREIEQLRNQLILRNDELLKLREQMPKWVSVAERLREIGGGRFCDNVNCRNRYVSV